MTSIDLETLFTTIYVLVDDWYQHEGHKLLKGKAGAKARFTDSELLTLLLAHDFVPYPGETRSSRREGGINQDGLGNGIFVEFRCSPKF